MARDERFEPVYRAFAAFRERCLIQDRSILWPEREIWTITNLEHARRRFVEGFIQGRLTFREKLEAQLSGAPDEVWALLADCFYVYGLPSSSIRFETRQAWISWAAGRAGLALLGMGDAPEEDRGEAGEPALWQALRAGFAPTGQKYNLKHAQLRLLILLALEVKAGPDRAALLESPARLQSVLDEILAGIPLRLDRANDMRNAILYMAFPDSYEPILSNRDKDAILAHYRAAAQGGPPPGVEKTDRDAALHRVRESLAGRFGGRERPFDFYLDLRQEWRPAQAGLEKAIAAQLRETQTLRERRPGDWRPAQVAGDPDEDRILAALRLTRNVILYGPPGTGKTYLAQRVAQRLVESGAYQAGSPIWWVTLHASYTYEDFVEGLRPVLPAAPEGQASGDSLAYEVRPGVFRAVCRQAAGDPGRAYVLVLDEINRANLAKILGELVTLIEDDKRGALSARLPYSGLALTVPPNLILLGTMNTADRSITLLDTALRRRFAFVEIAPRPELLAGALVETEEAVLHLDDLLRCLNAAVRQHLGRDHQVGHSYFLQVARAEPSERLTVLELVWNHQVLPLLAEYFYNRRDRLAEVLTSFIDEGRPDETDFMDAASFARLSGEDLVVALSRLCG